MCCKVLKLLLLCLEVCHLDVKDENVLMSKVYEVAKICYIGMSHIMEPTSISPQPMHGAFDYAAPESLLSNKYAAAVV